LGNVEQKALTSILKLFETIWFQMKSPLALAAEDIKNQILF